METTKEIQVLEKSAVKVKITVPGEEIKKEYNELVKNYCKTVQIKGFRKGKVPQNVLIRKFGDALKEETFNNILQKSVETTLEGIEEKPLPFSQPKLVDEEKLNFELEQDFTYEIEYDTYPKVELGPYTNLEVEEPEVAITDEDMDRELKQIQDQNALVVDKKDPVVAENDVITMDYMEVDAEGNEITGTKREGFTFTVGTGYNLYQLDEDVIGLKKDEEKEIKKSFPEDYRFESLAGKEVTLKVKITNIKEKQIPELDDELAQDVSDKYETLEDLKTDIRKKLEETLENKIKENKISQLIEQVVKSSIIDLPESIVQRELMMKWQNALYRFGAQEEYLIKALGEDNKTKDDILAEWRPATEEGIKSSLVVEEMVMKEKIETTPEEEEEELQKLADQQGTSLEEMKQNLTANRMLDSLKINIRNQKLFTQVLKNTKIKKGKKYKYLDFIQDKQDDKEE